MAIAKYTPDQMEQMIYKMKHEIDLFKFVIDCSEL